MFDIIKSETELLERLPERTPAIKNLSKLPQLDYFYLLFISGHQGREITPDIVLYGYEDALRENRLLEAKYPDISSTFWLIGTTGQGDSWFLDRKNGSVLFFDHEQGDYEGADQFLRLGISFSNFLRLAFLFAVLEELLDSRDLDLSEIEEFKAAINRIQPGLYALYPFDYFK